MEQKVVQAARDLADGLQEHLANENKLRGAQESEAQKLLAQEYTDFTKSVKARREANPHLFADEDDDVAVIDNPTDKYLRFAVEGDDYILKPGRNEITSFSIGIPAARIAALASAQLFSPHGVTLTLTKGKATLRREETLARMAESSQKEADERAALDQRLKSERDIKETLQGREVQRVQSQAGAAIARLTMPPPAPVLASQVKGKAAPPGTPIVKDTPKTKAEVKAEKQAEAKRKSEERKAKAKTKRAARRKK